MAQSGRLELFMRWPSCMLMSSRFGKCMPCRIFDVALRKCSQVPSNVSGSGPYYILVPWSRSMEIHLYTLPREEKVATENGCFGLAILSLQGPFASFHWLSYHLLFSERCPTSTPTLPKVGLGCPQPVCSNTVLCDSPGR